MCHFKHRGRERSYGKLTRDAVPETITREHPDGSTTTETRYRVDLRELELKATRLEAELERTRRELLEVRMGGERDENERNSGTGDLEQ